LSKKCDIIRLFGDLWTTHRYVSIDLQSSRQHTDTAQSVRRPRHSSSDTFHRSGMENLRTGPVQPMQNTRSIKTWQWTTVTSLLNYSPSTSVKFTSRLCLYYSLFKIMTTHKPVNASFLRPR